MHRTLVSEGTDRALEIAGENVPTNVTFTIETYPPTKPIWTWRVPERFVVHEAYLEMQDGRRVVDFAENPLHLVSYSTAIDRWLKWEDLEPHLHFSTRRPDAIPWIFKYYERNWGFCLSKNQFDSLPRDQKYHVVIKTEFGCAPDEGLRVGFAEIPPQPGLVENAYVLVNAHICHPMQSNDDASGVATSIGVLQRIAESPLPPASMGIRFLFGPETIGTICYLAHHENDIPNYLGGIFVEMTGNHNQLTLQRSRQGNHLIDRVMQYVLAARGLQFRQGMFREIIRNDEMVINGPGVDIPCISLSRWPYDEYHTSDDNPDIIHEEMLANAADVVTDVLRIFCSNYVPVRTFRGPIFLSGYQLHVDQHVNRELNKQMEKIMLRLEGAHSIFDIAQELELDYFQVREIIERFRARGLVRANLPSRKVHQ